VLRDQAHGSFDIRFDGVSRRPVGHAGALEQRAQARRAAVVDNRSDPLGRHLAQLGQRLFE